jgi:3',5'-nucleoside bisphosphate phosphatase
MKRFRADLHVHSVLSPCAELEMSPVNIIREAAERKIDILAITDHNSTYHSRLMMELGEEAGIMVIPGAEVNTKEEIHCLTLFENIECAEEFQKFLDSKLPLTRNNPALFGEQLVVDREEHILMEVEPLLISALGAGIYEVRDEVKRLGGIFIPAHIDRPFNSIHSQLGFIPDDLFPSALEVSARFRLQEYVLQHPELAAYSFITNSDAHTLRALGRSTTLFEMREAGFSELKLALGHEQGRKIVME